MTEKSTNDPATNDPAPREPARNAGTAQLEAAQHHAAHHAAPRDAPPAAHHDNPRRRGFKLAGTALVSAAALGGWLSGCAANAQGGADGGSPPSPAGEGGGRGWFGRGGPGGRGGPDGPGGPGGPPDPERVERFLASRLDRLGASAEQKDKILVIARQAMAQLKPYHERMRDNRRNGVLLLTATSIDRVAFEGLRAGQIKDFEASSAIISKTMLDAAEVLSPEQRLKVREHLEHRRGGPRRWR